MSGGRTRAVDFELGPDVLSNPVLTLSPEGEACENQWARRASYPQHSQRLHLAGDPPVTTPLKVVGNIKTAITVAMSFRV